MRSDRRIAGFGRRQLLLVAATTIAAMAIPAGAVADDGVMRFEERVTVDEGRAPAAAAVGAAASGTWVYTSLLSKYISGSKQWTYEQEIVWTGNGSTISAYTPTDNSNYKATGWTWSDPADDPTSTYTSGGVQYKRKRTNGWYGFACVSGVCLDEDLPWVKSTVGGNGSYANNGKGW